LGQQYGLKSQQNETTVLKPRASLQKHMTIQRAEGKGVWGALTAGGKDPRGHAEERWGDWGRSFGNAQKGGGNMSGIRYLL